MGKELDKFAAEHKKLKTQMSDLTVDAGSAASKRMQLASANATEGEGNLRDALVTARKNGVKGASLGDFMKDRGFQEAVKLLNQAASDLESEVKALEQFSQKATTADAALTALEARIDKDLVKRKDSSESKKDIEALLARILDDQKICNTLANLAAARINPANRSYGANLPKTITKLVQGAPEEQAESKHANEAPQKLVDRNLNSSLQKCLGAHKALATACSAAVDKAAAGDKSGAQAELKTAAEQRKIVAAIAKEYADLLKEFKDHVEGSKDKAKILASVAKMAQADDESERTLRGVVTTMKKAG